MQSANRAPSTSHASVLQRHVLKFARERPIILGTISGPLDRNKEKLEAILLHNYIFPDIAYTLHGFGLSKNGEFQVIVTQPYVYSNDIKLSQLEINQFALKIGFKKDTEGNHNYTNGNIKLRDLHNENIMMDHWGNIRVIDNIIRLT